MLSILLTLGQGIENFWYLPAAMELIALLATVVVGITLLALAINGYLRSLKISKFSDKYVLITGCDTGIGYKAARKLDSMGFHVFACCLMHEKAIELAAGCSDRMVPLQMDVTKEDSVLKALAVVKEVLPQGKGLWALVNNAGIVGPVGLCTWLPKEKFEESINVNFLGMVAVTQAFLPLVRRVKGRIIVASSVVGRVAVFPPAYTVSKYCLEGYTDWLRFMLLPQGISIHTFEPGGHNSKVTDADIHIASMDKEYASLSQDMKDFYGEGIKHTFAFYLTIAQKVYRMFQLDSVADQYIHAVSALFPKVRYVIGWDAHFFYRPLWTMPTWLADFVIGSAFPKPRGSV